MKLAYVACAALAGGMALCARAGEGAENEQLRKALKDIELVGSWLYDDLASGFAAARRTGKPLLVVFR